MLTTRGVGPAPSTVADEDGPREIRPRRSLPNGRAVLGGFLIAVSVLGVFTAARSGDDGRRPFVVAARDLEPGRRIRPSDLTTVAMALSDHLSGSRAFGHASQLEGAVVVAPVAKGELVQASAVARSMPPGRQVSFAVDQSRAIAGSVAAGETVDVLATYGAGSDAYTVVVARRAAVVAVAANRGTLGDQSRLVVTLTVPDEQTAIAIGHATTAGTVTLVRTTGAGRDPIPAPATYQPSAEGTP